MAKLIIAIADCDRNSAATIVVSSRNSVFLLVRAKNTERSNQEQTLKMKPYHVKKLLMRAAST
ncbi:hypothetical protein [Methylocystis echinoides]|uniref:hypothetical protein n=1 Tax=Methylocystis echinoides TaxID=29468 RepID=UPI002491E298|nr:hypothetical protein [Methylocystis echinoides]